jgi:hypothetical protein
MIKWVKGMKKMHINYVHLVPTAQSVVEIVPTCAVNVHLERIMINLVSFGDHDKTKCCS